MSKKIFIYQDEGVGNFSFKSTKSALLKSAVTSFFSVEPIDAKSIIEGSWQDDCALLVIPGGRDIPYHNKLSSLGTANIRNYLNAGGAYLGICAGAYFGSEHIVFEEGREHEVIEKRELGFFPGRAVGTLYSEKPFSYQCGKSAHPALIKSEGEALYTYYNGGCYFENAHEYFPDVEVIASYQNAALHDVAAIILCQVGQGKALLSGVHFEVDADASKRHPSLFQKLGPDEKKRQKLFDQLLTRLLVNELL